MDSEPTHAVIVTTGENDRLSEHVQDSTAVGSHMKLCLFSSPALGRSRI